MDKFAILLLAAGASSRLGQPKQLVPYKNQTLINYLHSEAIAAEIGEVLIVLGKYAKRIADQLKTENYIINDNWEAGLGSSIAYGINAIMQQDNYQGIYLLLCDQYKVDRNILRELAKVKSNDKKGIIISNYGHGSGPPAYFDKKYFKALSKLNDDKGAKKLIEQHLDDCTYFLFSEGVNDLDTPKDLEKLNN